MKWAVGELMSNTTIIKDGVDLKERFYKVLDEHPFANKWSNAAKKVIAKELYLEVIRDCVQKKKPEEWREKIQFNEL